jgi:hypothetical protein
MGNFNRHPAEVTADRLGDHVTKWSEKFTADERDEIGHIIHALNQIAGGER